MKIFRHITHNWNNAQVATLRKSNIFNVETGVDRFYIYDLNLYKKLIPLFKKWEVNLDFIGTDFSKKEILSAEYCIVEDWNTCGYPMPDGDMGYLYNTYETKDMCPRCGIGLVQKDDFRVRRLPKYPFWGLGWIFDEFFVRTDLYEKIFKPLGIECRPIRKYKKDTIIDSFVQLVIPVIDEALDLSAYAPEICPHCGATKYDPKPLGYYPQHEHPLPHIYKSKEYFGDGFSANRKIFVSAMVRDLMIENKMMRYRDFVPCAKAEELGIKNQGLQEWIDAGWKRKEIDLSNIIVAIPSDD